MEEYGKDPDSRSLGALLRDIRESKLLTSERVASRLKIDKKQVEALENENYMAFSAHVYARGVFERYASFLQLDAREALRLFEYSWQTRVISVGVAEDRVGPPPNRFLKHPLIKSLQTPFAGMIGALIIILALVIWGSATLRQRSPSFAFIEPPDRSIVHESLITVKGTADPRIELTLNKQPIYIGDNGAFQHYVLLQKGVNALVLEGRTTFGGMSKIIKYIVTE